MRWRSCWCTAIVLLIACRAQPVPSTTEHLQMQLRTSADSNGSLPVYYALRTVADESVFAEGYDDALRQTLQNAIKAGVVAQGLLRPGSEENTEITVPRDQELLVYVFFTSRQGTWKLRVQRTSSRPIALLVGTNVVEQSLEDVR